MLQWVVVAAPSPLGFLFGYVARFRLQAKVGPYRQATIPWAQAPMSGATDWRSARIFSIWTIQNRTYAC
ncbi:MAG: hypothetical protein RJA70_3321 [Pseudomonadota bacterium]|jgi:hypothetical protein